MHEFSIGQWLIALLIVLAILGARELRRFRNERREVPLGVESARPAFVYGEKAKGVK